MDLSTALDSLPHDLLIAKMEAYGFGKHSLRFLYSYLGNRKQRTRVGSAVSGWLSVLLGLPQGSILGPILFNIFINDLFFFVKESFICNFADDNTLYVCNTSIERVLNKLDCNARAALDWFRFNCLVANPSKFLVLFLGVQNSNSVSFSTDGNTIYGSNIVTLLGVKLDDKLCFLPHVKDLCNKANQKKKALLRIRRYLTQKKAENTMRGGGGSH